jgi:glycolate oxidase FAD binding subunit
MREVAAALDENGQFAPFDPPDALERSLGGLVADGRSGPLWAGYGDLRNHVLGVTVVTGDGRVLRLGGRVVKNVAGFDLIKPMTGSRGALGVIVSVCLRAFPRPAEDRLLALPGPDVRALLVDACRVGTAPVLPASTVVVSAGEVEADGRGEDPGDGALLLVRLHGARVTVDSDQRSLEAHLGKPFEVVEAGAADELRTTARDRAAHGTTVIEASTLPSRLAGVWSHVEASEPGEVAVDPCAGRIRLAYAHTDTARLTGLARAIETSGSVASTDRQVAEIWHRLTAEAAGAASSR